jgi:hypothetical protein
VSRGSSRLDRQGVDLAREAFSLIETAEDPSFQADVLLDLAEVLFLADQAPEAVAAARTAVERHGIKGNTAGVRRATRALDELTVGRDPLT